MEDKTLTEYRIFARRNSACSWTWWDRTDTETQAWEQIETDRLNNKSLLEWKVQEYVTETRTRVITKPVPAKWEVGHVYKQISGGLTSDQWVCVHVFATGAAGLIHSNPESDVIRRLALADREYYQEAR